MKMTKQEIVEIIYITLLMLLAVAVIIFVPTP
jgi:hypothetical protein